LRIPKSSMMSSGTVASESTYCRRLPVTTASASLRIPRDVDQRSELMSITIPK
jgi:hypothetical protein